MQATPCISTHGDHAAHVQPRKRIPSCHMRCMLDAATWPEAGASMLVGQHGESPRTLRYRLLGWPLPQAQHRHTCMKSSLGPAHQACLRYRNVLLPCAACMPRVPSCTARTTHSRTMHTGRMPPFSAAQSGEARPPPCCAQQPKACPGFRAQAIAGRRAPLGVPPGHGAATTRMPFVNLPARPPLRTTLPTPCMRSAPSRCAQAPGPL